MLLQVNNVTKLQAHQLAQSLYTLLQDHGAYRPDVRPDMYWDEFDFENWYVGIRIFDRFDPDAEEGLRQAVIDFCASQPGGGLQVVDV